MLRYLPPLLYAALTVYCLIDCLQSRVEAVRSLPKLVWVVVIALVPLFGSVGWLIAGRPGGAPRPRVQGPAGRPQGPDDDPEFLRRLNRGPSQ